MRTLAAMKTLLEGDEALKAGAQYDTRRLIAAWNDMPDDERWAMATDDWWLSKLSAALGAVRNSKEGN